MNVGLLLPGARDFAGVAEGYINEHAQGAVHRFRVVKHGCHIGLQKNDVGTRPLSIVVLPTLTT